MPLVFDWQTIVERLYSMKMERQSESAVKSDTLISGLLGVSNHAVVALEK